MYKRSECATFTNLGEDSEYANEVVEYYKTRTKCTSLTFMINFKIPNELCILKLIIKDEYEYKLDKLPDKLYYLDIIGKFKYPLTKIPKYLLYIKYGMNLPFGIMEDSDGNLTQKIDFPDTLQSVEISCEENYPIISLPKEIKRLCILGNFNSPIDLVSYDKLQYLAFGNKFNQSIDKIPKSLEELHLGNEFNQPIDLLYTNLKFIIFGEEFNQNINLLPNSLESIQFGNKFSQSVNSLPLSLKNIIFSEDFNLSIDSLPNNIENIYLPSNYNQQINKFPKKIKLISVHRSYSFIKIPNSLIKVRDVEYDSYTCSSHSYWKCHYFDSDINYIHYRANEFVLVINARNSEYIILHTNNVSHVTGGLCGIIGLTEKHISKIKKVVLYSQSYGDITFDKLLQIKKLRIIGCTGELLNLPDTVTHLIIERSPFQMGSTSLCLNILPDSITHITFLDDHFNLPINKFPGKLKHLILGANFNQPLLNLPESLITLKIGSFFNSPIVLPKNLIKLNVQSNYQLNFGKLPSKIKYITIGQASKCKIIEYSEDLINLSISNLDVDELNNLPLGLKTLSIKNISNVKYSTNLPMSLSCLEFHGAIPDIKIPFGCNVTKKETKSK